MLTIADLQSHPKFAEVAEKVKQAGSDSLDVFGGQHQGGYHVQQHPDEFAALVCLLLKRCRMIKLYGEIGVAAGGTTRLLWELVGFDRSVLIDDGNHPKHMYFAAQNVLGLPYQFIKGDSHSQYVADTLKNHLSGDAKFDVVFIDGDHSYDGVKQDIELVKPYCDAATLLVFHDTRACDGVKRAFEEFSDAQRLAEFVTGEKTLGIGVVRPEV